MKEWIVSADSTDDLYGGYFEMYKELIRCKDCIRYEDNRVCELYHAVLDDDDYCSRAERRN